jgi:hypothetical protein
MTYLCRLSQFLSDYLPLVLVILLDCLLKSGMLGLGQHGRNMCSSSRSEGEQRPTSSSPNSA